ncbi:hypothetical protein MSG37_18445 [Shewanella sp. 1CM18E]|uniref:hypothetical protein n=1 Tax=Shewanella sp. 1CM18E TaxID=2929169 RepID=UPI0020BF3313|nr:hypothetical protein [Shewanella sp. 1CM18E]MCK8046872.1 hypothetical protein [Shewanella sp. 1CM18E]
MKKSVHLGGRFFVFRALLSLLYILATSFSFFGHPRWFLLPHFKYISMSFMPQRDQYAALD